MKLRPKVVVWVVSIMAIFFFVLYSLISFFLLRDFSLLEKKEIQRNTLRVLDAYEARADDLAVKISDWGQWDDTYNYIENRDSEYTDSNLQNEAFQVLHINFVIIADHDGNIIYQKAVADDGSDMEVPTELSSFFYQNSALFQMSQRDIAHGVLMLPQGPVIAAARSVTTSDGAAPSNGMIFFGYYMTDAGMEKISNLTHLKAEQMSFTDALTTDQEGYKQALLRLSQEMRFYEESRPLNDKITAGYALVDDLFGKPAIVLRMEMDRELFFQGRNAISFFAQLMLLATAVFIMAGISLFEMLVLRKIDALNRDIEKVVQSGDSAMRVSLPRANDEFKTLAEEINKMLGSLHAAEEKRKESERRFQTVADSAPVMIWTTDETKKCTYLNKVWLDFTGRALEQELGFGWKEDVHPDDIKDVMKKYEKAHEKQEAFHIEFRLKRFDGVYRWVYSSAIPHIDSQGEFHGYIGSAIDITERKEIEEQRMVYVDEIERMNKIMIERELKMIELKEKLKNLETK